MQHHHATPFPARLPIILGAAMVLSLAGLTYAGPDHHRPHGPPGDGPHGVSAECQARHFAEHGAAFDKNGDGKLDRDERHAMHQAKRQRALTAYDKDGDGRLSRTERKTMHHDRMVERFEGLDKNRDAEITLSEATGSCSPIERRFAEIDADSDGSITWTEFEKASKRFSPEGRRRGKPGKRGPAAE